MTNTLAERRRGRALTFGLIAAGLVVVAAVTTAIEMRSSRPDLAQGLVVPGLDEQIQGGQRIIIVSHDATYRIEKAQRGESAVWVMRDRGDYPVLPARLAQLTEGLEQLRFTRRMTSDPSKHERLGVTDPREGGRGILVQIEDAQGALLVNLILGVEPSGTYVRRPDDPQTWATEGELPPLRDVASWLDLQPIELSADRIARVEIMPANSRAYILARDSAEQPWRIASPSLAVLAQSTVASAAEKITDLSPVDVQPAPAIQGAPTARVRVITFDGVAIDSELIPSEGRTWLKLVARVVAAEATPEQQAAAQAINDRVSAWAYALSDMEAENLAPPLNNLIPSGPP